MAEPPPDFVSQQISESIAVKEAMLDDDDLIDDIERVARRIVASYRSGGKVLIAGNGHSRADRGVPWYLGRGAAGAAIVSVGLLEVVPGEDDPAAYAASFGAEDLPFDFVWFTPRVDDQDPCEVYAEQLRRAKQRHEKKTSE